MELHEKIKRDYSIICLFRPVPDQIVYNPPTIAFSLSPDSLDKPSNVSLHCPIPTALHRMMLSFESANPLSAVFFLLPRHATLSNPLPRLLFLPLL